MRSARERPSTSRPVDHPGRMLRRVPASRTSANKWTWWPLGRSPSATCCPAPGTGTFFALALQNPGPADSIVSVELWDAGEAVASATLTLPSGTKVSREVSELFPGVIPGAERVLAVTATVPVQMLGLRGNEDESSVTPVLPALASP